MPRDDYFMGLAHLIAFGSRNPHQPVGALVTDCNGRHFAFGTDSMPAPLADLNDGWDDEAVIHAEVEALHMARFPLGSGVLYVSNRPCLKCVCEALHLGIKRVVFNGKCPETADWVKVQEVMRMSYMQLDEFKGDLNWLRDQMKSLEVRGLFG
jgi:deoxycytidylate deaminase